MATYNFKVRATDERGAYSDRDFSINVRNTLAERYMVLRMNDVHTSPDLTTWTTSGGKGAYFANSAVNVTNINGNTGENDTVINRAAYGNGIWAVQFATTNILNVSRDGINWTTATLPSYPVAHLAGGGSSQPGSWSLGIIFAEGYFYSGHFVITNEATASIRKVTTVFRSADLVTWERVGDAVEAIPNGSTNFSTNSRLAWCDGNLVIHGGSMRNFNSSNPGVTTIPYWILQSNTFNKYTINNVRYIYSMRSFNGLWLACGYNTVPVILTSTDGISWTGRSLPTEIATNSSFAMFDVAYGNGRLVATIVNVGNTGSVPALNYISSLDGLNWTYNRIQNASGVANGFATGSGNTYAFGITYTNGYFIMFDGGVNSGGSGSIVGGLRLSRDGVSWTAVSALGPVSIASSSAIVGVLAINN